MSKSVRALLICPRYDPHSFWSFEGAVEVLGAKYPTSPLGLITLAALLPSLDGSPGGLRWTLVSTDQGRGTNPAGYDDTRAVLVVSG